MIDWWNRSKDRLRELFENYGTAALVTWFSVFLVTLLSIFFLARMGVAIEGTEGTAATLVGAYAATQLTKPVRIAITVVLTPLVAAGIQRFRAWRGITEDEEPLAESEPTTASEER